jgi:DNA-binding NarL/FixJ family response regulator
MRVAIGDSNELDVHGLKALCLSLDGCEEVLHYDRCNALLKADSPDIIILDYTADGYGLDSVARIRSAFPDVVILAITSIQSASTIFSAIRSGVNGYVKKDCSIKEIKESIHFTLKGRQFYCGEILRLLNSESIDLLCLKEGDLDCSPVLLTDREVEILSYIAVGHTNTEIAEMLFLSSHTVNTHRKNILGKIGAKNTAGAVIYAVKEGIVDAERFQFSRS